jgi:hypothetical protein
VSETVLQQIQEWGPVEHLVAPTKLHVWRLKAWHTRFPGAKLWAPPQIPHSLERLPFVGVLGDGAPAAWSSDLDQLVFRGNLFIEEVQFLHKASGTLIFGDFIQNYRRERATPFLNILYRLAGVAHPHGGVPLDIRLSFINRHAARNSLAKLLSWDFDKLIVAHGLCVETDAKRFVERAFQWLC